MKDTLFVPGAELSFKTVIEVRARLYKLLMNTDINYLQLDLSQVSYCDSAGIALLIEARKFCKKNNKHFEILGMPEETQSLADFCGVKEILEVM